MKQGGKILKGFGWKPVCAFSMAISVLTATSALAAAPGAAIHETRTFAHKNVPVMMLSLPGRGVLLSAPGEIATVVIENGANAICSTFLARTDNAGVVEVPVARTTHCHSPRIVVYR